MKEYFLACYDDQSWVKACGSMAKQILTDANKMSKKFYNLRLQQYQYAANLLTSVDFHHDLIASLSEKQKGNVMFYFCNIHDFFEPYGICDKALKLYQVGKKDEAIKMVRGTLDRY